MDGRRKPDPKPENENELIDEEIIDLTQVIEGGDDDDIIDLNDILEQPDQAADKTDEMVIPLVDAIPDEKAAALPDDTDDEIIDLEDVATTLDASLTETELEVPPLPAGEPAPAAEADEDIIDLLDVTAQDTTAEAVLAPPSTDDGNEAADLSEDTDEDIIDLEDLATTGIAETEAEDPALPADEPAPAAETDEDVIDLLDVTAPDTTAEAVLAPPSADDETDIIDLTDIDAPATATSDDPEFAELESRAQAIFSASADAAVESGQDPFDVETPEEAAETAGPDAEFTVLEEEETIAGDGQAPAFVQDPPEPVAQPAETVQFAPVTPPPPPADESVALTDAQVEAALERVVEKIYGEKIEQMMIQTIEKTVKREIEKIKNALLEDTDGMVG